MRQAARPPGNGTAARQFLAKVRRWLLLKTFQRCDICYVLWSTRSALVANEVFARYDKYSLAAVFANNAIWPGVVKCETVDCCNDVNSDRLDTDLEGDTGHGEIVWRNRLSGCAECSQRTDNAKRIFL